MFHRYIKVVSDTVEEGEEVDDGEVAFRFPASPNLNTRPLGIKPSFDFIKQRSGLSQFSVKQCYLASLTISLLLVICTIVLLILQQGTTALQPEIEVDQFEIGIIKYRNSVLGQRSRFDSFFVIIPPFGVRTGLSTVVYVDIHCHFDIGNLSFTKEIISNSKAVDGRIKWDYNTGIAFNLTDMDYYSKVKQNNSFGRNQKQQLGGLKKDFRRGCIDDLMKIKISAQIRTSNPVTKQKSLVAFCEKNVTVSCV